MSVMSSVERVTAVSRDFSCHCAKQVVCHYAGLICLVYVSRFSSIYVFGTALMQCPVISSL